MIEESEEGIRRQSGLVGMAGQQFMDVPTLQNPSQEFVDRTGEPTLNANKF